VVLPVASRRRSPGIPHQQMYLEAPRILIVVGVALDTMKQLQTQLVMRQYRGSSHDPGPSARSGGG